MRKIAIFVEGQTELIFVREFLLKVFDYQVSLECFNLRNETTIHPTEYANPVPGSAFYFEIINVGNDVAVLSRILHREQYLWNAGFEKIIGLRDMYSRAYLDAVSERKIDPSVNKRFQQGAITTIREKAQRPNDIHFSFAVMEIEAWILAFEGWLESTHPALSRGFIAENLRINLTEIDPETTFFHPAKIIADIYSLVGLKYEKDRGGINSVMGFLQTEDFKNLYHSDKCASFNQFIDALPPVLN